MWVIVIAIAIAIVIVFVKRSRQYRSCGPLMKQLPKDAIPELRELVDEFEKHCVADKNITLDHTDETVKYLSECVKRDITPAEQNYHITYEHTHLDTGPKKRVDVVLQNGEVSSWEGAQGVLKNVLLAKDFQKRWYEKTGVRVSGFFYYPPNGFREWHTNIHTKPGWRLYYVRLPHGGDSYFTYKSPKNGELYKVKDRDGYFNLFNLDTQSELPLWHNVYCDTAHRFSLGIHISDEMARKIIDRL